MTLLSIAHRYEFLGVREHAIKEIYGPFRAQEKSSILDTWDPMETELEIQQELQEHDYQMLISVAEKYDVSLFHVVPLLVPFVVRKQPLTVREVLRFSALTLTRLVHAREDYLRESGSSKGWARPDAEAIVYGIWQPEVTVESAD